MLAAEPVVRTKLLEKTIHAALRVVATKRVGGQRCLRIIVTTSTGQISHGEWASLCHDWSGIRHYET